MKSGNGDNDKRSDKDDDENDYEQWRGSLSFSASLSTFLDLLFFISVNYRCISKTSGDTPYS